MFGFFWCTSVHAAAREAEQRQRGGEVSGDQRGRPAEWEPAVDDQEHVGGEATAAVLQQSNETAGFFFIICFVFSQTCDHGTPTCTYS